MWTSTFMQYTYSKSRRVRLTGMAKQPSCTVETAASWSAVSASNETGLDASADSVLWFIHRLYIIYDTISPDSLCCHLADSCSYSTSFFKLTLEVPDHGTWLICRNANMPCMWLLIRCVCLAMQGSSYYFFFANLVANPVLMAYS